jgi:acyl-CoA synthetase (AMP-forming)/AMP-acid ligase II
LKGAWFGDSTLAPDLLISNFALSNGSILCRYTSVTLVGARHVTLPSFEAGTALRLIEREGVTVTNMASTMVAILCHNPVGLELQVESS